MDMTFHISLLQEQKIFRRDQNLVKDLSSLMDIMRYNAYKSDPYSEANPVDSICARGDLLDNPVPFGCIDSKLTSFSLQKGCKGYAISGPTTFKGLPPFSWSLFNDTDHEGEPDVYDFDYIFMDPNY